MEVKLQENYGLYIDGKWVPASDGATLKVINPATGQIISNISEATESDVDKAVKAAQKAFESWKNTSLVERQNVLLKIADIIEENRKDYSMEFSVPYGSLEIGTCIGSRLYCSIKTVKSYFSFSTGTCKIDRGCSTCRSN